jgi:hypothetical protein
LIFVAPPQSFGQGPDLRARLVDVRCRRRLTCGFMCRFLFAGAFDDPRCEHGGD